MVTFTINGSSRTFDGDADMPLLWYLRDELGLTGTKFGCGGGFCGACTVHVDGQAVRSCQTPMSALAGTQGRHHRGPRRRPEPSGAARLDRGQRRAVRLLPDRPDHAGGGAPRREAEARPTPRSTRRWPATSAGAARISAFARPSRARRRDGHERLRARIAGHRHRQRQPPALPRRRVLGRRLRRRRPLRAGVAARARQRRRVPHRRRQGRAQSERLSRHRSRRHGAHRHAPLRDGDRHPHVAADGRRRRARRRLGARQDRAGHRRRALRRPEHRRLEVDPRLLRCLPPGRGLGARDADPGRGGAVAGAGRRVRDRPARGRPQGERPTRAVRLARARGGEAAGAEGRDADAQAAQRLALHRQGSRPLRPRRHRERQGRLRDGRQGRRDGLRVDRAAAGPRRDAEVGRRQGRARR